MASNTKAKVIGDVLEWEADARYSREVLTLATSQTCIIGSVLYSADGDGPYKVFTALIDELQTIAITGDPTGDFTITFVTKTGALITTDPITAGASVADVQTGVDTALGASMVTVAGTDGDDFTLEFTGVGYTGIEQVLVVIGAGALVSEEDISITRTTPGGPGDVDFHEAGGAAVAVSLEKVTTTDATTEIVCLTRDALVNSDQLSYGTATKALVEASLKKVGILIRTEPVETY